MKKLVEKNEEKDTNDVEFEISIVPLLLYLLKNLWLILLVGVVTAAIAFSATKLLVTPTYRCSFTAYVNNKHASAAANPEGLSSSDVNAAKDLVRTYSAIITSNSILAKATMDEVMNYSESQLKSMVSTEIQEGTEIIKVYVETKTPEDAYEVAKAISSVSPEAMSDIVEGSSMKIVEYPQMPKSIYKPDYKKYTLLGFGAGVLLMIIILIARYLKNDTIRDEAELENRFSCPVLGVIPDVNSIDSGKSGYYYSYEKKDKEEQNSEKK